MDCNLTSEGIWRKRISVPLSAEERAIIKDKSDANAETRRALQTVIKERTFVICTESEAATVQAMYQAHADPTCTLIAADIETEINTGIINCLNAKGEHVQIRF